MIDFISKKLNKGKEVLIRLSQWISDEGALNMETSALLMAFLMFFMPVVYAAITTIIGITIKSIYDTKRGHKDEWRDFICCLLGVVMGFILGSLMLVHGLDTFTLI